MRLVAQPQELGRLGVECSVPQSPKSIRKHWGPSRRDAPYGAYSTPTPATRDGVTARPIQPRRRTSLSTVAKGQAGRWHGPCPSALKPWTVIRCSLGRCAGRYRVLVGTLNPPHPSRGSRPEHEPEYTPRVESCLHRCRDRPDSERGEPPASSGDARLREGASLPLRSRRRGCHLPSLAPVIRSDPRVPSNSVS